MSFKRLRMVLMTLCFLHVSSRLQHVCVIYVCLWLWGRLRPLRSRMEPPGFPRTWDSGPILFPWLQGIPMGIVWAAGSQVMQVPEILWCNIGSRIPMGPPKHPTQTISCERIMKQKHRGYIGGSRVDSHELWPDVFFFGGFCLKMGWFCSRSNGAFARNWATRFSCHSATTGWGPGTGSWPVPGSSRLPVISIYQGINSSTLYYRGLYTHYKDSLLKVGWPSQHIHLICLLHLLWAPKFGCFLVSGNGHPRLFPGKYHGGFFRPFGQIQIFGRFLPW